MQRRGSHSANMLKPTVEVIQGEQHQQEQQKQFDLRNRRSSLPMVPTFGGQSMAIPKAPAADHNHPAVAPLPQSNVQWPLQQPRQQGFGQPQPHQASTRHSFASSMDLISPSVTTASSLSSGGTVTFQNNNLFKSSSHHTSHTAAAGDLLTMTRRTIDPPLPNQINAVTKKRSSTETDASVGNGCPFNFTSMNRSNSTGGQHQTIHLFGNNSQQQQQQQQNQQSHQPIHHAGGPFAPTNPHITSHGSGHGSASYVSSSTMGDNDDSYQEHRTIRQCRRPDSFEMMMNDD